MKPTRKVSRRSFAASVLGGVVLGGSATALLAGAATAQTMPYTGVTDADSNDQEGRGIGVRNAPGRGGPGGQNNGDSTGCSDADAGPGSDPGGRGVRCGGQSSYPRSTTPTTTRHCTDSDSGNNADPVGQGVRC